MAWLPGRFLVRGQMTLPCPHATTSTSPGMATILVDDSPACRTNQIRSSRDVLRQYRLAERQLPATRGVRGAKLAVDEQGAGLGRAPGQAHQRGAVLRTDMGDRRPSGRTRMGCPGR